MKLPALCLAVVAALLAGSAGHTHFGGLSYHEKVGMARADSACDGGDWRAASDPASGCVVSRRGEDK